MVGHECSLEGTPVAIEIVAHIGGKDGERARACERARIVAATVEIETARGALRHLEVGGILGVGIGVVLVGHGDVLTVEDNGVGCGHEVALLMDVHRTAIHIKGRELVSCAQVKRAATCLVQCTLGIDADALHSAVLGEGASWHMDGAALLSHDDGVARGHVVGQRQGAAVELDATVDVSERAILSTVGIGERGNRDGAALNGCSTGEHVDIIDGDVALSSLGKRSIADNAARTCQGEVLGVVVECHASRCELARHVDGGG